MQGFLTILYLFFFGNRYKTFNNTGALNYMLDSFYHVTLNSFFEVIFFCAKMSMLCHKYVTLLCTGLLNI